MLLRDLVARFLPGLDDDESSSDAEDAERGTAGNTGYTADGDGDDKCEPASKRRKVDIIKIKNGADGDSSDDDSSDEEEEEEEDEPLNPDELDSSSASAVDILIKELRRARASAIRKAETQETDDEANDFAELGALGLQVFIHDRFML